MRQKQIKDWLHYWHNAHMVNFRAIHSLATVWEARIYCPCMRRGLFENVADKAIWKAIKTSRDDGLMSDALGD